ncbi:MAG: cytochrome c oxidase subunit 3 [Crocinitomicaceae bacterium]
MAGHATKQMDAATLWGGNGSPFSVSYGKMMMWFFLVSDALTFGGLLVAYGYTRYTYTGEWPAGEEVFHHFPLAGETHLPLLYVAFMTFVLIVSSVTMVLAVEAGHRMDKKGVIKWLALTIVGGFIFLGSQVWEWSHFIHGSEYGKITMADGSVMKAHYDHGTHEFVGLEVVQDGAKYKVGEEYEELHGDHAVALYKSIEENEPYRIVKGANLHENEYGPSHYGQFFFFITGFHGFHVFSGVVINILVLLMVIKGTMHKRNHYEMVEKTGLYWHFVDLVWVFVFTFFYLV